MSRENPTPLRLGASGTLHGWRVRVIGRVVMGMDDGGETYYWQEFNLVDESGNPGTLVYEETDDGPEWKLFTTFQPRHPMTAREAVARRVGDTVNLDGTPTKITLVDQSRVYHIEGDAPEGVEVGDVANYFNADAGERMLVASWTGDDIEFYEGRDLRAGEVASAFRFTSVPDRPSSPQFPISARRGTSSIVLKVVGLVLAGIIAFAIYSCGQAPRSVSRPSSPPVKRPAPALKLPTGAQGMLHQEQFSIASQAVVEIGRVGMRHERREYQLIGDRGRSALLVHALNGPANEWHLFTPMAAPRDFQETPPYAAAALKQGATIALAGRSLSVLQLFLTKVVAGEGAAANTQWPPVQYGLVATERDEWMMARWTESSIQFHLGSRIPESDVLAAFAGRAPAPR